jgi:uncharacterized protein (DUF305 family)
VLLAAIVMVVSGCGPGTPRGVDRVESEYDFLARMVPHHEEAVDAAEQLLEGTQRAQLRTFARDIIETQTSEIEQMLQWLDQWYPDRDIHGGHEPVMRDLSDLRGDGLDRAFLEDMIPHHMDAVMASQQLLINDLAEHQELVSFAASIRDQQRREIMQMRRWLAEWFEADGPRRPGMHQEPPPRGRER